MGAPPHTHSTEHGAAPDCQKPPLRCGFRQQVSLGVGHHRCRRKKPRSLPHDQEVRLPLGEHCLKTGDPTRRGTTYCRGVQALHHAAGGPPPPGPVPGGVGPAVWPRGTVGPGSPAPRQGAEARGLQRPGSRGAARPGRARCRAVVGAWGSGAAAGVLGAGPRSRVGRVAGGAGGEAGAWWAPEAPEAVSGARRLRGAVRRSRVVGAPATWWCSPTGPG
jgi:hypothetical protein